MFGNLFGNLEEQQKQIKTKLAEITVSGEAGDGAIKVVANANRQIIDITINPSILNSDRAEELEDLLMVATNRALELAAEQEAAETQKMIKDMLPPGMDGLAGMFG